MMNSKRRNSTDCNGQVTKGVVDLPPDLISNILFRLPIESILVCRVVCKTWCDVIQDSCFINELDKYQPTRLILKPLPEDNTSDTPSHLLLLDIEERKTRCIPIEKMFVDLQIMCSFNGLLCMASAKNLNPVVIFNPLTRERVILPPSHSKYAISRHEVGLGFDPSTDKYKVVRAYTVYLSRRKVRKFEIISLGGSSWRKLSAPQRVVSWDGFGVASWNGALYWTMTKGIVITIVQLDLRDEKFRVISFPDYFPSDHVCLGLMDFGGYLTLIQNENGIIELWRLTGNELGGDLSFSLQDTYDTHVKWGGGLCCEFICQSNKDSYLLQVGFWTCQKQRQEYLTQYFPEEKRYLKLEIPGLPNSFRTACFKPSLIPLPGGSFCSR